jgi:hypothetical protein
LHQFHLDFLENLANSNLSAFKYVTGRTFDHFMGWHNRRSGSFGSSRPYLLHESHFVESAAQRGDDDANADSDIIVSELELKLGCEQQICQVAIGF